MEVCLGGVRRLARSHEAVPRARINLRLEGFARGSHFLGCLDERLIHPCVVLCIITVYRSLNILRASAIARAAAVENAGRLQISVVIGKLEDRASAQQNPTAVTLPLDAGNFGKV